MSSLRTRAARALRRSRLTSIALGVTALYLVAGIGVGLGLVDAQEANARVGPGTTPGFWGSQGNEKRLADCRFTIETYERTLGQSDPAAALQEPGVRWFERRAAELPLDELRARVAAARESHDSLRDVGDLDGRPEYEETIARIERRTAEIFQPLEGLERARAFTRTMLGTDRAGRSISMRAFYAIFVALKIGLVTALFSVVIGSLLGAAAAFFGGWLDHVVTGLYTMLSSIPQLILLMVLAYSFAGSRVDDTLVPVYVAFCATFWIGPCRVIRGETLKLKEMEYVQAATALGFPRWRVLCRHVLPNTAHLVLVHFSLLFVAAVKSEVILSYLGLGVKGEPSWGTMIRDSAGQVSNAFFWQLGAATGFMLLLVLAFNVLADALQDALDPRQP